MYRWIRPLLFRLDAETAHRFAIRSARLIQTAPGGRASNLSANLEQDLWGIHFSNPVGIAAGLDKNAECLPYWTRIGCGFAEVGSVSADSAPGNPRPRVFRLPKDRALINRMGLNNDGAEAVVQRLPKRPGRSIPVIVNIVKTHRDGLVGSDALDDFTSCYQTVAPHADLVTLNVSCPNTAEGKTFEEPASLDALLEAIENTRAKQQPLLVKLSPPAAATIDEGRYAELLSIIRSHEVDGIVAANTATDRSGLTSETGIIRGIGKGGLSGRPVASRSTRLIRFVYRETDGRIPIIGVGGIDSAEQALVKIRAGASLVQLYTGLVYEGPGLVKRIAKGLARHLDNAGKSLNEIVGEDA